MRNEWAEVVLQSRIVYILLLMYLAAALDAETYNPSRTELCLNESV